MPCILYVADTKSFTIMLIHYLMFSLTLLLLSTSLILVQEICLVYEKITKVDTVSISCETTLPLPWNPNSVLFLLSPSPLILIKFIASWHSCNHTSSWYPFQWLLAISLDQYLHFCQEGTLQNNINVITNMIKTTSINMI